MIPCSDVSVGMHDVCMYIVLICSLTAYRSVVSCAERAVFYFPAVFSESAAGESRLSGTLATVDWRDGYFAGVCIVVRMVDHAYLDFVCVPLVA